MQIRLNGAEVVFATEVSLEELLLQQKINLDTVIVELNQTIIKRDELAQTMVKDQDTIEVLRFVGGG
ncbi:MAG: sulfur carrier protein ThiS [Sporomusaceae bacterium]|nr:sulfur carrier protein ThiS [Sporomusaceae bacterium]